MNVQNSGECAVMVTVGGMMGLLAGFFGPVWQVIFLVLGALYGFGAYVCYEIAVAMYLTENGVESEVPKLTIDKVGGSFLVMLIVLVLLGIGACANLFWSLWPSSPRSLS